MNTSIVLFVACGFIVGFAIAFLIKGKMASRKIQAAKEEAVQLIRDAKRRSSTLLKEAQLEAKDRLFKMKSEFDNETKETRSDLKRREQRLLRKEENIEKKLDQFEKRDQDISKKEQIVRSLNILANMLDVQDLEVK